MQCPVCAERLPASSLPAHYAHELRRLQDPRASITNQDRQVHAFMFAMTMPVCVHGCSRARWGLGYPSTTKRGKRTRTHVRQGAV